jgi:hypothetical protein
MIASPAVTEMESVCGDVLAGDSARARQSHSVEVESVAEKSMACKAGFAASNRLADKLPGEDVSLRKLAHVSPEPVGDDAVTEAVFILRAATASVFTKLVVGVAFAVGVDESPLAHIELFSLTPPATAAKANTAAYTAAVRLTVMVRLPVAEATA